MTHNSLPHDVERVVNALCEDLATPISLGVYLRVKYGCWDDLASMQVDPKHYVDAERYWADAQAVSLLRKCQDLPTSIDRKAVALENFWACEHMCFRTNDRLRPYLYGEAYAPEDAGIYKFILRVRKIVKQILGPCPDLKDGRFGPGATFGDRGLKTTVPDKMSSRPTLTSEAVWFMFPWTGTAWAKACASLGQDPEFIRGNRFTTVPKDCTKDRGIAVEPSINVFYQLAYGQLMKDRLFRAGLTSFSRFQSDKLNAQIIHKRVACEASIRGHFASIDLSNASDTVCSNLVELLLPAGWFEVLSTLRSPFTLVQGRWVKLEKFSSMGNGYTFELETVLFAAICMAAVEASSVTPILGENVFVFGDDLLVPTQSADSVIAVLRYLGFVPNAKKTFVSGPFRESCGGDFFDGVDVRPYFLKEFPREPQQFIAMANGLRRVIGSADNSCVRHLSVRRAWFCILDALPSSIRRLRGPEGLGDLCIHDEQIRWQVRWRNSIRYVRVYRPARFRRVSWDHFDGSVVLASGLYGAGDTERQKRSEGVTPRDAVTGYKVGWVPHS